MQYSVHDHHNYKAKWLYCNVILLVATREAMGLSGWQPQIDTQHNSNIPIATTLAGQFRTKA